MKTAFVQFFCQFLLRLDIILTDQTDDLGMSLYLHDYSLLIISHLLTKNFQKTNVVDLDDPGCLG